MDDFDENDFDEPVGEYPPLTALSIGTPIPLVHNVIPEQWDDDERWLLGHVC